MLEKPNLPAWAAKLVNPIIDEINRTRLLRGDGILIDETPSGEVLSALRFERLKHKVQLKNCAFYVPDVGYMQDVGASTATAFFSWNNATPDTFCIPNGQIYFQQDLANFPNTITYDLLLSAIPNGIFQFEQRGGVYYEEHSVIWPYDGDGIFPPNFSGGPFWAGDMNYTLSIGSSTWTFTTPVNLLFQPGTGTGFSHPELIFPFGLRGIGGTNPAILTGGPTRPDPTVTSPPYQLIGDITSMSNPCIATLSVANGAFQTGITSLAYYIPTPALQHH